MEAQPERKQSREWQERLVDPSVLKLSLRKRVGSCVVDTVAGHAMLKEQWAKWLRTSG